MGKSRHFQPSTEIKMLLDVNCCRPSTWVPILMHHNSSGCR
jgi:hypothetical protein